MKTEKDKYASMTDSELFSEMKKRLKNGKGHCDAITDIWDDGWTECPICGCKANEDNYFVHKEMQ